MKAEELIKEYIKEEKQDDVRVLILVQERDKDSNIISESWSHLSGDEEFDPKAKQLVAFRPVWNICL